MYPVGRPVGENEFERRFAVIQQNAEEYTAILVHLGLGTAALSADQKHQVYAESKTLNAITLDPAGGAFRFSLRIAQNKAQGTAITGTIAANGSITATQKTATVTTCPICLAGFALIDTPAGRVQVEDLRTGMTVWSRDRAGARTEATLWAVVRRTVPIGTSLLNLVLDDGRAVVASAAHPTADGRVIGDLGPGDELDGARVASVTTVSDSEGATYDILPAGDTGEYWANGILLKSTLTR